MPKPISSAPEDATAASFGLLATTGDQNIMVDGNEAHTGATILDGAKLETAGCVSATVRWGSLNRVDLPTNSVVVIHYGQGQLKVRLARGCARTNTLGGPAASIETPEAKTIPATEAESSDRGSAEVCYPVNNSQSYEPHCGAPVVWFYGRGAVGTVAVTVALRGEAAGSSTPTLHW